MRIKRPPLFVWVSDLHINATMAVRYPTATFDDGDQSIFNSTQKALWEAWVEFWDYVKSKKRRVVIGFGGEIADNGNKHSDQQVHTHNNNEIVQLVADTIDPALQLADKVIVIRGTAAHVGKQGGLDEMIAKDIDNVVKDEEHGTFSHYHYRCNIGGKTFDLAHHTRMGTLPWTEKNAANKLAKLVHDEYIEWGEKPPDFALRGHVHRISDSGLNFPTRALISGCWVFPNEYVHRLSAGGKRPHIGGFIIDTENGLVEWRKYEWQRNTPERIG